LYQVAGPDPFTFRIAVDEGKLPEAIELIREAIADEYISPRGKFKPKKCVYIQIAGILTI